MFTYNSKEKKKGQKNNKNPYNTATEISVNKAQICNKTGFCVGGVVMGWILQWTAIVDYSKFYLE